MDNRKKITNKSINICDQLLMIMQVLDTYAKNKREEMKLYRKLDDYRQMDIPLIQEEIDVLYYEEVTIEKNCSSGYYVLFWNYYDIVCHRYCKGPKEGWNLDEYGYDEIYTFGAHCSNCGCNYSRYRFKNFYTTKEKVKKNKKEKTYRTDANAQQKESKKKIKDKLNKDINEKKLKINILKSKINKSLKEGFEYIYQLAMNNKELNADVLSEDKEKYGYSKQILKENMETKIIKILLIYLL